MNKNDKKKEKKIIKFFIDNMILKEK